MSWVGGEAARNLVSGTTHALRYALVLAAALGALVVAEISSISALAARAGDYQSAGGSVRSVRRISVWRNG
ncbi:MAG: hypothetical protein LBQ06_04025 [Frankiaceae bacterium]|jgi:hypothetical protein|nr:hypothetical protein [Frankiaceae bacterium]